MRVGLGSILGLDGPGRRVGMGREVEVGGFSGGDGQVEGYPEVRELRGVLARLRRWEGLV